VIPLKIPACGVRSRRTGSWSPSCGRRASWLWPGRSASAPRNGFDVAFGLALGLARRLREVDDLRMADAATSLPAVFEGRPVRRRRSGRREDGRDQPIRARPADRRPHLPHVTHTSRRVRWTRAGWCAEVNANARGLVAFGATHFPGVRSRGPKWLAVAVVGLGWVGTPHLPWLKRSQTWSGRRDRPHGPRSRRAKSLFRISEGAVAEGQVRCRGSTGSTL